MPQKYGERWFFHLIPSAKSRGGALYEKLTAEELQGKYIISQMNEGRDRWFPMFAAVEDPYALVLRTPEEERTFAEVIRSYEPRKPYLDVDGPVKIQEELIENVAEAIYSCLKEQGLSLEFVLSDMSDERKTSFHVVVQGTILRNNDEGKEFMLGVREKMPSAFRAFVDDRVYLSIQHLRLPGCHKEGTQRVKPLGTEEEFYERLVTNVDPERDIMFYE